MFCKFDSNLTIPKSHHLLLHAVEKLSFQIVGDAVMGRYCCHHPSSWITRYLFPAQYTGPFILEKCSTVFRVHTFSTFSPRSCTVKDTVIFPKCMICQSQLNIFSIGTECGIGMILKIWCGGSFLQMYSCCINPNVLTSTCWHVTNDLARLPTRCKMRAQGYVGNLSVGRSHLSVAHFVLPPASLSLVLGMISKLFRSLRIQITFSFLPPASRPIY